MKRIINLLFCLLLALGLCACSNKTIEPQDELEKEIGAFEITAYQRELAAENEKGLEVLDAGRGNPNWINSEVRYAYARFLEFAVEESELTFNQNAMAGQAQKEGISQRFLDEMTIDDKSEKFLIDIYNYCVNELNIDGDDLLKEWVDGIIGDYYPTPSRCLTNTELILNDYLQSTLYNGVDLKNQTDIFATEGGSAAMCYIFEALSHNKLLKPDDKIAIATPIFTPYLQIPDVKNYGLVSINVNSSEETDWIIPDEELKKLEDPSVKAFFLVNPSNPGSHSLSQETLNKIKQTVEKNPELIILTDDVYGTFVNNFQTVYSVLPYNTILVYSFSKLYGVTGHRIGLIAMNENNICDALLKKLDQKDKDFLDDEYSIVTTEVENMKFIDRVCADSRSIGLYHTSGLSTPSQIFMDFLSLSHLIYKEDDPYIKQCNEILNERYETLMDAMGYEPDESENNAKYYALINVGKLAEKYYGKEFKDYLFSKYTQLDLLNSLAKKEGVVVMYGPGFDGEDNTIRFSLANLDKEDYIEIGRRMEEWVQSYIEEFELQKK